MQLENTMWDWQQDHIQFDKGAPQKGLLDTLVFLIKQHFALAAHFPRQFKDSFFDPCAKSLYQFSIAMFCLAL